MMMEENLFTQVARVASPSDLDSGGGNDRGREEKPPGTGRPGKGIVDVGGGLDVGSGHEGREDGGQSSTSGGGATGPRIRPKPENTRKT